MRALAIALTIGCSSPALVQDETETPVSADEAIARIRERAGLPAIRLDDRARDAAAGHCAYVIANGELTHYQQQSKKRFTGVAPTDRLTTAGFAEDFAGEVLADVDGGAAIEGFINSVYHRALFLRAETTSYGWSSVDGCTTIDFGRTGKAHGEVTVLWPPDGATDVPTEFAAVHESPNPLPGRDVVGAPISLIREHALGNVTATIAGPAGALPFAMLTHENDPNHLVRVGEVHVVPLAPLAANASYRVEIRVNDGTFATRFTTRS